MYACVVEQTKKDQCLPCINWMMVHFAAPWSPECEVTSESFAICIRRSQAKAKPDVRAQADKLAINFRKKVFSLKTGCKHFKDSVGDREVFLFALFPHDLIIMGTLFSRCTCMQPLWACYKCPARDQTSLHQSLQMHQAVWNHFKLIHGVFTFVGESRFVRRGCFSLHKSSLVPREP